MAMVVTGVVCYQISYWVTVYGSIVTLGMSMPLFAGTAGFITTLILAFVLKSLTHNYPTKMVLGLAVRGGILGLFFIYFVGYQDIVGPYLFFILWQTPMLILMGAPLMSIGSSISGVADQGLVPAPSMPPQKNTLPLFILYALIGTISMVGIKYGESLFFPHLEELAALPDFVDKWSYVTMGDPSISAPWYRYSKDNNTAYAASTDYNFDDQGILHKIEGADPETFTLVSGVTGVANYAKDKNHVYFGTRIVQGADPETFVSSLSTASDSESFPLFALGVDRNHVFIEGLVIPSADRDTFQLDTEPGGVDYAKDKNYVYVFRYNSSRGGIFEALPNSDPQTFVLLGQNTPETPTFYAKDKNQVYAEDHVLQGADPASFTVLTEKQPCPGQASEYCFVDAQDKNHLYESGNIVR